MELNKLLKRKQKARDENNQQLEAESCNKLGNYYLSQDQFEKALNEFLQEASIYEKLNNKKMDLGRAHRMIGEVYTLEGKYKDALKHEDIYLKYAKQENDLIELQRAYATVGRIYLLKVQTDDDDENENPENRNDDAKYAEKAFLKSLSICQDIGNTKYASKYELADMQARLYLNLGVLNENISRYDEAIKFYQNAIKISKSNDLFEFTHQCLMSLGSFYSSKRNDTMGAMQAFNNAIEIAKRIDCKNEKMCETLYAKSELLIQNGDYQSAKQVLKKAFRLKTKIATDRAAIQRNLKIIYSLCKYEDELIVTDSFDYERRKNLFEKLGDATCRLKNYKKAIDFYHKMLESAELNGDTGKKLIPIYVSLYQTYIDMREYEEAQKFLHMEYELIRDEPKEACTTLMSMGNLLHLAKKDFWEVDAVYRKALNEARKCDDDVSLEMTVLKRIITICKEHKMISLAEILEHEASERNIDLNECSDDVELSEDIVNSCDILNDIDIDFELSSDANSSDNDDDEQKKVVARKKRSMAVKKNAKGETRLHEACINGNYQLVKLLLDQGHPIIVRDNAGWLPLHEASNHGHRDIVELLLDSGARSAINDKGGVNCDGISPLFDAASNGHLSVVKLLLDRGAKATIKTDGNQTPLDALLYWHSNDKNNLTAAETELYEEIKNRLTEQCERVGIDTNKIPTSSFASSGYCSIKSRNSQASQQQRHDIRFNTNFSDNENENDNNDDFIKKSARLEYKSVMQKLKHPQKEAKITIENSLDGSKKRSAYLNVQEVEEDDWLDDDLGPTRKKQKFYNENALKPTTSSSSLPLPFSKSPGTNSIECSPQKSNLSRIPSSNLLHSDTDDDDNIENVECLSDFDTNAIDAFDVMMNTNGDKKKIKTRRNSNSIKLQRRNSNQSSLLDAGFSRFIEFDDGTRKSNYSSPIKVSTTTSSHNSSLNESFNRTFNQMDKQTIIKVQIGEEKIIVPINKEIANELKISWLIDESARRYYCLKGIRPELKLKTSDGATLIETDPLSLILCVSEENLIFSEILDWKLPSLSNRYLEACSEYKCGVDRDINDLLELNRAAINIDISNQNLRPTIVRPIFKALQHQTCLVQLDVSSNFIQDEGVKYLSQTLITLKHLTHLDMSGNGISEGGIEQFCSILVKSSTPTEIKCLKLNFNPIKSSSLRHISELCRSKSIMSLHLMSCELVNGNDMELLNCVKELNISYNQFSLNGLKDIFRKLNATIVESLNLERCSMETNLGLYIVDFITSGCINTLKEINLSALKLSENEILDIMRCLHRCENLIYLDFSYQSELTFLSLKYLLYDMSNKNLRVNLIGCKSLQSTSGVFNIHHNIDNSSSSTCYPRHVQLSLAKTMTETERNEYIMRIKELWSSVSRNYGNVQCDRNLLHLVSDSSDIERFL